MPGKNGQKKQILFDSTMLIGYLRGNKKCREKIENVKIGKTVGFISVVTIFELYIGAFLSKNISEALRDIRELMSWFQPPLEFDEASAQKAAYLFSKLKKTNEVIELSDLFIMNLIIEKPKVVFSRIY